jgi:hypothetical protein
MPSFNVPYDRSTHSFFASMGMNPIPNNSAGVLLCALLVGCTTDENLDTGAASVSEGAKRVVSEMNSFAEQVRAERRYRYDLQPNCMLKVERLLAGKPAQRNTVKIDTTHLVKFDYAPGLGHGLRAPAGRSGAMISIFDASNTDEIKSMQDMLHSLTAACASES